MEPEVALGEVLRALRRRKGLSQEALAHAAEVYYQRGLDYAANLRSV